MRRGGLALGVSIALLCAALSVIAAAGPRSSGASSVTMASPSASPTPVQPSNGYDTAGQDKTLKADLIDALPMPPELVVLGGSRAMRFQPSYLTRLTGLSAFNCAVQCFRPEDAWAYSSYLFQRAPAVRLRCVMAIQARTFVDDTMRAGLLYDDRLARAFPADLLAEQRAALGEPEPADAATDDRYLARGFLLNNRYDYARSRPGFSFSRYLDTYIADYLPSHRWTGPLPAARSRLYFEKTVRLYNSHGVEPLIIIMPFQPDVLRVFREAGYGKYEDILTAYLADAQTRCRFRVLDLTDISTFGGSPTEFYDGAHPTAENSRRIIRYAVSAAPECFR